MITLEPLDDAGVEAWREGLEDRLVATRVRAGIPPARAARDVSELVAARLGEGDLRDDTLLHRVLRDGTPVGALWVQQSAPAAALLLELGVPAADAADTVEALRPLLRERGVENLEVAAATGDVVMAAVVERFQPQLVATHMQLDLSAVSGEAPRVHLSPMTEDDFAAYRAGGVQHYAHELFEAGDHATLDDALGEAARQFAEFFPLGLDTPGQHVWQAHDGPRQVGVLWIFVEDEWSFVYDIEMVPEVRGQGYGTEVLVLGADAARSLGATHLGLNVFGHNAGAQRLYSRTGFVVTRRFHRIVL